MANPELGAQTQFLLWMLEEHIHPGWRFETRPGGDRFDGYQDDSDGGIRRSTTYTIVDGGLLQTSYSGRNRYWDLEFHNEQGWTHGLIERWGGDLGEARRLLEIVRPSDKQLKEMESPYWAAYFAQQGESEARIKAFRQFAHTVGVVGEAGLRLVPGAGWTLDIEEAFTGRSAVSGRELSAGDHAIAKASAGMGAATTVAALAKALDTVHEIMKVRSVRNALDGSSGLTVRLRNMPAELLQDGGQNVGIFGQALRSSSKTPGHGEAMYQFILSQPSDKYEYFVIQRNLRTATNAAHGTRRGLGAEIMDVIGVRRDGRIDLFEITSRTQTNDEQLAKLRTLRDTLPAHRRGDVDAWRPGER